MRVACVGYRDWALEIYDLLAKSTSHQFLIFRSAAQYDELVLNDFKPNLILYYGWSWMVASNILDEYNCVMLHPSPLPKYRGGSPIQNQIIDGVEESAVTLFLMTDKMDSGPILQQKPMSLSGSLEDIFERMVELGVALTKNILVDSLDSNEQDETKASYCKRRTPSQSEITIHELETKNAAYLYNKIRMLQDPYPNPYFTSTDGKKIVFKIVEVDP